MKNYQGLTDKQVKESREKYGKNLLTPPPSTPWWKLLLDKFKDPIIMILLVAAVISIVVGIIEGNLIEPIGIIIAILLATGIGFYMEWSAKKKFDILNKVSDTEPVKVIRNGLVTQIPKDELVVGDVVLISTGDEIPADIELTEATDLKISESTMTGESVPVTKRAKEENEEWNESGYPPYLTLRSTNVMEGNGVGIVVKVGDQTEIGKTTRQAMEETNIETPLQKQLNGLASLVSKCAFGIAGLLLVFLNVHHFFFTEYDSSFMGILTTELGFFMMAVVLIVAAVPEGLPISSTLSLSYAMKAMAKDNCLMKNLLACETIGSVDVVLTDKTGTLTQNRMTVVDKTVNYNEENMILNAAVNSTAELGENDKPIGNPSEGAIIKYLKDNGENYQVFRDRAEIVEIKPFNSTDKYMATTIYYCGEKVILIKGAPEVVIEMCSNVKDKEKILSEVASQQERGRRALGFVSGSDEEHLSYDGTYFIEDPIRPDVPDAVKKCYEAGVDVWMVTGDNLKTAAEIGRQAGFSRRVQGCDDDIWAVEAKDWNDCAWEDPNCGAPNIISRNTPENKLEILKETQKLGRIVAMVGDGIV